MNDNFKKNNIENKLCNSYNKFIKEFKHQSSLKNKPTFIKDFIIENFNCPNKNSTFFQENINRNILKQ